MTKTDLAKLIRYWMDGAEDDWVTVQSLKRAKRYAAALFYIHLSLEKQIKGMIVTRTKDQSPFGHRLLYLLGLTGVDAPRAILDYLEVIDKFNTGSRYPDLKSVQVLNDKNYFALWYERACEVRKWLQQQQSN